MRAGWRRLRRHSYRLGLGWVARGARATRLARRTHPAHLRPGLYRLLVPLEPWRFWELGRVADQPFSGRVLDIGSPKLLPSLLQAEGSGEWVAIDLLQSEVAAWRAIDPALDVRVADARALPFPDRSFDACTCVSVIEHVPGDGDSRAMAEIWRVLRPGGVLHLVTNVAASPRELTTPRPVYGPASPPAGPGPVAGAFFERHYGEVDLGPRLLAQPWEVLGRECVRERRSVHRRFFAARPASFALGGLLALVCPRNFVPVARAAEIPDGAHAALYLRLRRPVGNPGRRAAPATTVR